jgi:hypothetical protein
MKYKLKGFHMQERRSHYTDREEDKHFILVIYSNSLGPCRLVVRSSRCGRVHTQVQTVKTQARILAGTLSFLLAHKTVLISELCSMHGRSHNLACYVVFLPFVTDVRFSLCARA